MKPPKNADIDVTTPYPLKFPYTTAAGTAVDVITLRRLNVGDMKAARRQSKDPNEWDEILIARSAGLVTEDLDNLDLVDFHELQGRFRILAGLVKPSQEPEKSDSAAGEVVPVATERD